MYFPILKCHVQFTTLSIKTLSDQERTSLQCYKEYVCEPNTIKQRVPRNYDCPLKLNYKRWFLKFSLIKSIKPNLDSAITMVSLYSLSCKKYTSYPRVKGGFNLNNSCAIQLVIINKNYIKNIIFFKYLRTHERSSSWQHSSRSR